LNFEAYPKLSHDEFLKKFEAYEKWKNEENPDALTTFKAKRARDEILKSHIPYCRKMASSLLSRTRHSKSDEHFEELVVIGMSSLLRALSHYDPTKGYKFTTYAYLGVEQDQRRHIRRFLHEGIRIPEHLIEKKNLIARITASSKKKFNRLPTEEEIAAELEVTVDKLREYKENLKNEKVYSLNSPVGENTNELIDFIPDDRTFCDLSDEVRSESVDVLYSKYLGCLTADEQNLIKERYGLSNRKRATRVSIAKRLGKNTDHIRNIERRCISKMKAEAKKLAAKKELTEKMENNKRVRTKKEVLKPKEVVQTTGTEEIGTSNDNICLSKNDLIDLRQDKMMPLKLFIYLALTMEGFTGCTKELDVKGFCDRWAIMREDLISTVAALSKRGIIQIDVESIATRAYSRAERQKSLRDIIDEASDPQTP